MQACQHVARAAATVTAMLAGTHPHAALPLARTVHAVLKSALHNLKVRRGWRVRLTAPASSHEYKLSLWTALQQALRKQHPSLAWATWGHSV